MSNYLDRLEAAFDIDPEVFDTIEDGSSWRDDFDSSVRIMPLTRTLNPPSLISSDMLFVQADEWLKISDEICKIPDQMLQDPFEIERTQITIPSKKI